MVSLLEGDKRRYALSAFISRNEDKSKFLAYPLRKILVQVYITTTDTKLISKYHVLIAKYYSHCDTYTSVARKNCTETG